MLATVDANETAQSGLRAGAEHPRHCCFTLTLRSYRHARVRIRSLRGLVRSDRKQVSRGRALPAPNGSKNAGMAGGCDIYWPWR